jgi:hypothetical protein
MSNGPFHRLESPTQTSADAIEQVRSGEIWGRPARGSSIPCVKAYRNPLPSGQRGIQFTTPVAPQSGSGSPIEARWYHPHTSGVLLKQNSNNEDCAVIPAAVINFQP